MPESARPTRTAFPCCYRRPTRSANGVSDIDRDSVDGGAAGEARRSGEPRRSVRLGGHAMRGGHATLGFHATRGLGGRVRTLSPMNALARLIDFYRVQIELIWNWRRGRRQLLW